MNETLEYQYARIVNADRWVPASGGSETPFKARSGKVLLYCWNPNTGKHAYLDVASDMILSDEDANAHLQMV